MKKNIYTGDTFSTGSGLSVFSGSAKTFPFSGEIEKWRIPFHVCSCGSSNSVAVASSHSVAAALLYGFCLWNPIGMRILKHAAPWIKALSSVSYCSRNMFKIATRNVFNFYGDLFLRVRTTNQPSKRKSFLFNKYHVEFLTGLEGWSLGRASSSDLKDVEELAAHGIGNTWLNKESEEPGCSWDFSWVQGSICSHETEEPESYHPADQYQPNGSLPSGCLFS